MGPINRGLAAILTQEWAVPVLVAGILLGCAFILLWNLRRHHEPMTRALGTRLDALAPVAEAAGIDEAQARFSGDYQLIDEAMRADDGSPALAHAWVEYAETVVDPNEPVILTTARPEEYLLHLGDDTRVLAWWANLFVAIGLTFTFLGIVAALTATSDGLSRAGSDSAGMSAVLTSLLALTAAKFWTSIAGVLASIILRFFDRRWHQATGRGLARLAHAIERGTVYLPPQRVAVEQLRELKQQSTAMTEFTTQLAVGISDALGEKMQPLVIGLSGIQRSLDDFKDGAFSGIRDSLTGALNDSAGQQMDALAGALTAMTAGLAGINERLEGSGAAASEQIATAAREFAGASEAMTRAFATLNGNIAGMADRLGAQAAEAADAATNRVREERTAFDAAAQGNRRVLGEVGEELRRASAETSAAMIDAVRRAVAEATAEGNAATKTALDGFAGATAGIADAFDRMQGRVAELGDKLTGGASDAAARNAEVLAGAAAALEAATGRAQTELTKGIADAAARSADESARAISAAFSTFGERFEKASAGLTATLTTTAGRMEALAGSIERATGQAGEHARHIGAAGREVQGVATLLGRAANDMQAASGPVREATASIGKSVGQGQELLRRSEEHARRSEASIGAIATSLTETSGAAGRAWTDYRDRFQGVDEALGTALDRIAGASREHADQLNEQVGRMDAAMAKSVDRLHTALDQLSDLAAALEDQRAREGAR